MNAWRLVPGACLPALLLCGLTALSEPAQAEPAPTYSSPGCTAVNGGVFNLVATPAQQYRSHVQSGFVPGDQLTFSISVTDTGADQWWIKGWIRGCIGGGSKGRSRCGSVVDQGWIRAG